MSNKLNPFEEQLKNSVQNHEVPYDASEWDKLSQKLDKPQRGSSFRKWALASVATMVVAAGLVLFFQDSTIEPVIVEQSSPVIEPSETVSPSNKVLVANEKVEMVEKVEPTTPTDELIEQVTELKVASLENDLQEKSVLPAETKVIVNKEPTQNADVVNEVSKEDVTELVVLPQIQWNKEVICAGTEFQASVETNQEVIWELGNGETENGKDLSYIFLNGGEYQLKAYLVDSEVYTKSVLVKVNPKPDASFTVKEVLRNNMVPVVQITANTEGYKSYMWSTGDGFSMHGAQVEHTYAKPKDYEISLRVVNKHGCLWTYFHRQTISKEFNLLAPNSFSPNSDGENDEWIPVALTSGYFTFELNVYDRVGNLVFNTTDPEQKFNGRVNGKLASSGEVFIWKAMTKDPSGIIQNYGGTILAIY